MKFILYTLILFSSLNATISDDEGYETTREEIDEAKVNPVSDLGEIRFTLQTEPEMEAEETSSAKNRTTTPPFSLSDASSSLHRPTTTSSTTKVKDDAIKSIKMVQNKAKKILSFFGKGQTKTQSLSVQIGKVAERLASDLKIFSEKALFSKHYKDSLETKGFRSFTKKASKACAELFAYNYNIIVNYNDFRKTLKQEELDPLKYGSGQLANCIVNDCRIVVLKKYNWAKTLYEVLDKLIEALSQESLADFDATIEDLKQEQNRPQIAKVVLTAFQDIDAFKGICSGLITKKKLRSERFVASKNSPVIREIQKLMSELKAIKERVDVELKNIKNN